MAIFMKKEFEKLSTEQLGEFVMQVPGMLKMLKEMNARLASMPSSKFNSVMAGDYGFYNLVYELEFTEHLSLIVVALNGLAEVEALASQPDPQEALLVSLKASEQHDNLQKHPDFSDGGVVALTYSLGRTIRSMVTYGRSISSLLQDARENNSQDSLLKAIRMDRAVVGCPTAMNYIAKAQIRGNTAFFTRLRSALKGPSLKPMIALEPLRYTLLILREMGINDLSQKDLERLFVEQLKVYPNTPGAAKNIFAQYQQSKKIKTI